MQKHFSCHKPCEEIFLSQVKCVSCGKYIDSLSLEHRCNVCWDIYWKDKIKEEDCLLKRTNS